MFIFSRLPHAWIVNEIPSRCSDAVEIIRGVIPERERVKSPLLAKNCEKWGTQTWNRGKVLLERFDGRGFVVFHVEDGVELGDLEQIVDLLGEVQELQFATLVLGGGEGADQFTDA